MLVSKSLRFVAAFHFAGCLLVAVADAQVAAPPVVPQNDQLAVAVSAPTPEEIVEETIDLNETAAGYAQTRNVSLEQAWDVVRKSCGLTKVASSPNVSGREFAPLRSAEIRPGVFQMVAGQSFFQSLKWQMESLRCGNKQIVMEVRIMRVSEELLDQINRDLPGGWTTGGQGKDRKTVVQPPRSPFQLPVAEKQPRPTAEFVSAVTKTERATPCRLARLDQKAAKELIDAIQSNTRSNILQVPKVTMFPGQDAVVSDSTQRPFVTSVELIRKDGKTAMQPGIEVLEEGLKVALKLDLAGDQVKLESEIALSKIGEVDTFTYVPEGESEETTIQIPELSSKKIVLSQRLGSGVSLLVAPHFYQEKVEKRGFPRREVKTREYLLLLLSPTVIDG